VSIVLAFFLVFFLPVVILLTEETAEAVFQYVVYLRSTVAQRRKTLSSDCVARATQKRKDLCFASLLAIFQILVVG